VAPPKLPVAPVTKIIFIVFKIKNQLLLLGKESDIDVEKHQF
jgi:hypothetical protein